jgi:hypothetical protein
MIYVGKLKSDGRQVMFGASDGRTYGGNKMWGVSAFDFTIPKAKERPAAGQVVAPGSVFIGYASIPGLQGDGSKRSVTKGATSDATATPPEADDGSQARRKTPASASGEPAEREPAAEPAETRSKNKSPASQSKENADAEEGTSAKHESSSTEASAEPTATPRKKRPSTEE